VEADGVNAACEHVVPPPAADQAPDAEVEDNNEGGEVGDFVDALDFDLDVDAPPGYVEFPLGGENGRGARDDGLGNAAFPLGGDDGRVIGAIRNDGLGNAYHEPPPAVDRDPELAEAAALVAIVADPQALAARVRAAEGNIIPPAGVPAAAALLAALQDVDVDVSGHTANPGAPAAADNERNHPGEAAAPLLATNPAAEDQPVAPNEAGEEEGEEEKDEEEEVAVDPVVNVAAPEAEMEDEDPFFDALDSEEPPPGQHVLDQRGNDERDNDVVEDAPAERENVGGTGKWKLAVTTVLLLFVALLFDYDVLDHNFYTPLATSAMYCTNQSSTTTSTCINLKEVFVHPNHFRAEQDYSWISPTYVTMCNMSLLKTPTSRMQITRGMSSSPTNASGSLSNGTVTVDIDEPLDIGSGSSALGPASHSLAIREFQAATSGDICLANFLRACMILGVGPNAAPADIQKVFRILARQDHPGNAENFIAIHKARDLLLSAADHEDTGATGCLPQQFSVLMPNASPTSSVGDFLLSIDTGFINMESEEVLHLQDGPVEASGEVASAKHDDSNIKENHWNASRSNDGNGVFCIPLSNRPDVVQEFYPVAHLNTSSSAQEDGISPHTWESVTNLEHANDSSPGAGRRAGKSNEVGHLRKALILHQAARFHNNHEDYEMKPKSNVTNVHVNATVSVGSINNCSWPFSATTGDSSANAGGATLPRQFGALVPNAVPTSSVKALLLSIDTGSINTEPEEVLQLPVGSVEASEVAYMEHDDVSKNNDGNGVVDISSRNRPEDVQEPSSDNTSIASGSSGSGSGNDANDHSAVNDVAILACSLVWHEKLKYVVCPSAMAELDRKEFGILNGSTEMRAGFVFCVRAFLLSGNEYDILYGSIFAVTVVLVLRIISWKKKKEEVKAAARIQSWIRHTLRKLRIISWKKKEEEVKAAARIQSWIRQTTLRKSRADAHRTKQRAARFNTWNEDVKAAGISFHVWAMVQLVKK